MTSRTEPQQFPVVDEDYDRSAEILVRFDDFPWFRQATIGALTDVEWPSADHLYWRPLDVDLAVRSIRTPADFPLVSRANTEPSTGD